MKQSSAPTYDIPYLKNKKITANPKDWGNRGFCINTMISDHGQVKAKKDFDPKIRMGWDEKGLVVLADITDDKIVEGRRNTISELDCFEIGLSPTPEAATPWIHYLITPGVEPRFGKREFVLFDSRCQPDMVNRNPTLDVAARKKKGGYVMEMRAHWSDLGIRPKLNRKIGLYLIASDADKPTERWHSKHKAYWYPVNHMKSMRHRHSVRLATKPSRPDKVAATGWVEEMTRVHAYFTGVPEMAGRMVSVTDGKQELAATKLTRRKDGRVVGKLRMTLPQSDEPVRCFTLTSNGKTVGCLALGDLEDHVANMLSHTSPFARCPVLFHNGFPHFAYERPTEMEATLGEYELKVTHFDEQFNKVTKPEKPGRYGAIVQANGARGKTSIRYRTLYRAPDHLDFADIVAKFPDFVGRHLRVNAMRPMDTEDDLAVLLSALHNGQTAEGYFDRPEFQDRKWWIGLKRKLWGFDKKYTRKLEGPTKIAGQSLPVLRKGTPEEAGMSADIPAKLDRICVEMAATLSQAVNVCLVRNNVVYYQGAFGQLAGGEAISTNTRIVADRNDAMLTALVGMMMAEQGLWKLSDPLTKYLPKFKGTLPKFPKTIKDLLWGWGAAGRLCFAGKNLEEKLIDGIPVKWLEKWDDGGSRMELAGTIMELITGEPIPHLFKRLVFDPLGITDVRARFATYGLAIKTFDLMVFCQMLMNKGKYADLQFVTEESFTQMLPERKAKEARPGHREIVHGLGLQWISDTRVPERTFGHDWQGGGWINAENRHISCYINDPRSKHFDVYDQKRFDKARKLTDEFIETVYGGLVK